MKRIALVLLLLGGCATPEQIKAAQNKADHERCESYGARRGTPAYTQCRVQMETNRNQLRAAAIMSGPTTCQRFGNTVSCY